MLHRIVSLMRNESKFNDDQNDFAKKTTKQTNVYNFLYCTEWVRQKFILGKTELNWTCSSYFHNLFGWLFDGCTSYKLLCVEPKMYLSDIHIYILLLLLVFFFSFFFRLFLFSLISNQIFVTQLIKRSMIRFNEQLCVRSNLPHLFFFLYFVFAIIFFFLYNIKTGFEMFKSKWNYYVQFIYFCFISAKQFPFSLDLDRGLNCHRMMNSIDCNDDKTQNNLCSWFTRKYFFCNCTIETSISNQIPLAY